LNRECDDAEHGEDGAAQGEARGDRGRQALPHRENDDHVDAREVTLPDDLDRARRGIGRKHQ
jgi:hypothetical protein